MSATSSPNIVQKPSLTLKRRLNAPPEKVYAAWTKPEQIVRWFGPDAGPVTHAETDVRVGGTSVYAMGPDGAGRRRLTEEDAIETMPALTSDGEWVVFSTDRAAGMKLWIQRVDGTEGRFLEPDRLDIPDTSMHARFSPDGAWVVFTSDRGGYNDEWPLTPRPQPYGDLWAVPVAGGPAVRLTHNKWEDGPCDWGSLRVR